RFLASHHADEPSSPSPCTTVLLSGNYFLLFYVMRQLKIAVALLLAVALPSALRAVWQPLAYVDLVLIVVVYFALKREPLHALILAAIAGLATDALSRGLLGAGGFSKVLTAYAVYFVASRVMLDTTVLRIPVLAGAALIDNLV